MNEPDNFNSVNEFLQEADLSEVLSPGAVRQGEFVAIYEGRTGSPQGTWSAEAVDNHGLDEFDRVAFSSGDEGDIHAFFFTEEFQEVNEDVGPETGVALSPSTNNLDFSGPSILDHLDIEPPVRFEVPEGESELLRGPGFLVLSVEPVDFERFSTSRAEFRSNQ